MFINAQKACAILPELYDSLFFFKDLDTEKRQK